MTILDAAPPAVTVDGNLAVIRFSSFDQASYRLFLQAKALPEKQVTYDWEADAYTLTTPARFADRLGVAMPTEGRGLLPCPGHPFDYQRWIVFDLALPAKRFACWCDTGLGKTVILLEWCRQVLAMTGGRVLILQPLSIHRQTIAEAERWYGQDLPLTRLDSREVLIEWCGGSGPGLAICNYEKLIPGQVPEFRHLAGLACDESSLLKSGGGVIKWNLIHSARGIEYKLSLTATPAPNDTMEYASQASFLEKLRTEGEILWTYFTRDSRGDWRVKPHARQAFYAFMASWSVYLRNPAHFGFADILATLPPPEVREYPLAITDAQRELMFGLITQKGGGLFNDDRLGVTERTKLSQLAKGFLYDTSGKVRTAARVDSHKPSFVADLVRADTASGLPCLVWTVFDEESAILAAELADDPITVGVLDGSMSDDARAALIDAFRRGDTQVLVSKPQLIGYGLNLQHVRSMVFSGFDDSFERMYQAVRRAYRYGQTETVRVHVPYVPELEGMVFGNIQRKQRQFDEDCAIQERFYREALMGATA